MQLEHQVAIIAGGGSGLGRATARMFAKEGADIAIVDLNGEGAQAVAGEVEALGRKALALPTNTTIKNEVQSGVAKTMATFGRVDILVNCVGVAYRSSVADFPEDKWDWVMDTHVKSMFLACQAVLKPMMEARYGRIVTIASRAAFKGRANTGPYSAAKGAMIALSRVIAIEAAPYGITVNTIAPGTTETPLVINTLGEDQMLVEAENSGVITTPVRLAKPEEQAAAILYLVGKHSDHVTGQTIHVNGGSYMP